MSNRINENESTSATESNETEAPLTQAPEATADTQNPSETAEQADTDEAENREAEQGNPNHEAAGYRRRLRDTEAERDGLLARVETMQRNEIDRTIRVEHRIEPRAVWSNGAELADLLDDDGAPDSAKIRAAATEAIAALGLRPPPRNYAPKEGNIAPLPRSHESMLATVMGHEQ